MANVFLKDNKIHLFFEPDSVIDSTGFTYELGSPAIDFLWLPLNEVDSILKSYAYEFLNDELTDYDFRKHMLNFLNSIYDYSPYFYFYIKPLTRFIWDIIKFNKDESEKQRSLEIFINSLSDVRRLAKSGVCNEMIENDFAILVWFCENVLDVHEPYEQLFNAAVSLIMSDIMLKREYMKAEVDFIFQTLNNSLPLSPNQKLHYLDAQRENKKYINMPFEVRLLPYTKYSPKSTDEDNLINTILDENITILEMYKINSLDELIRFEMFNMISNDIKITKCKYCGCYFVPSGRNDSLYCNRTSPTHKVPCSKIGAKKLYEEKVKNDPNLLNYKKAYNRMQSKYRNGKITQTERYEWTEKAKMIRKKYIDGLIDRIDL